MRIRIFIIILILIALARPLPSVAQTNTWTAWVYAQDSGTMRLIDARGVVLEEFTLPIFPDFTTFPYSVAVSPDGQEFVYSLLHDTNFASRIAAYSLALDLTARLVPPNLLSDSLSLSATRFIFNEEQNFAVGYSRPNDGWSIEVNPPNFEGVLWQLDSDNPLVSTLGLPTQQNMTPVIMRYQGTVVTFTLIPYGTEYRTPLQSYQWDVMSGQISADHAYPSLDADTYLPTGEVISAVFADDQPNHTGDFPGGQQNTLQVYLPGRDVRILFHLEPDLSLYRPRFVQHGRRILVGAFDEFATEGRWQLFERNGTPVEPQAILSTPNDFVVDAEGVADGFIYLTDNLSTDGTFTLLHVDTTNGLDSGEIVWIGPIGERQHIVWVNDPLIDEPVTEPFMDWNLQFTVDAQSAGIAPGSVPTPAFSTSSDVLTVGGTAIVQTTEGDQLNVRSGPGTEFEIIARLDSGTRVTLLEGPRYNGGFGWWMIEAGLIEGWVVESVENDDGSRLQTLIPG